MTSDAAQLFRQRGLQVTAQRLAVFRATAANPHVAADAGRDDVQEKFVSDLVAAWDKAMNLDRFDLAV